MEVRLFVTCLVDAFRPGTGQAAVAVLERRGAQVACPAGQTCCGQFAYNAGYREEAAAMARHWLSVFGGEDTPIIALSGSCAAMVRHLYPDLLAGTPDEPQARRVGERVVDLTQWLVGHPGNSVAASAMPVAVHTGCHMRRLLNARQAPLDVLSQAGARPAELADNDQCCGFGGTYAMAEPEVSTALADAKLARWREQRAEGAEALVGSDWGCLLHLAGRLSRQGEEAPVLHVAEWLDLADEGRLTPDAVRAAAVFGSRSGVRS